MTKERATLDADLASVQQMKDRNEQQRWELEMRMSKFVESVSVSIHMFVGAVIPCRVERISLILLMFVQIDKNIIGYNSMAQRLKIVPITAKVCLQSHQTSTCTVLTVAMYVVAVCQGKELRDALQREWL